MEMFFLVFGKLGLFGFKIDLIVWKYEIQEHLEYEDIGLK